MRARYLLPALALLLSLGSLRAQVPEGGAYRHEAVQVDQVVLEMVSQREVFLNITRVRGRTGQILIGEVGPIGPDTTPPPTDPQPFDPDDIPPPPVQAF